MYIVYFISIFFSFCPLFTLLIINCLSFTICRTLEDKRMAHCSQYTNYTTKNNDTQPHYYCVHVLNIYPFPSFLFRVLTDWCVSWEGHSICGCGLTFISLGLVQQVSLLLTNHLSRDMETLVTLESGEL